jgi:hypothetical protein
MAQVNVTLLFDRLTLNPGEEGEWFSEPVSPTAVRWFTAVPINPDIGGLGIDHDQLVQITDVWHLLKGNLHGLDHSGGVGDIQVNIRVKNIGGIPAMFRVYMAEAE